MTRHNRYASRWDFDLGTARRMVLLANLNTCKTKAEKRFLHARKVNARHSSYADEARVMASYIREVT